MFLQRIESGPAGEEFVVRDLPYEPIQFSQRKRFATNQMDFRLFVPRFGEILGGRVAIENIGLHIARTLRDRAKGVTT